MHYTLHQLQIFLKITQLNSVTKAAEALHLTQPAVSIQLKNFQAQFDFPLTEVIGRKIYITDFGKEIAKSAEVIMGHVDSINHKSMIQNGKLVGKLDISIVSTGKYIMPYFLVDFINKHPEVELLMDVTNKAKVLETLEVNSVDFSLVSVIPDYLNLDKMELMKNQLYLIGNSEVNFESRKNNIQLLEELPIIFRENGSATRLAMENFMKVHGISVRKKIELTSNEAVKQAVIAGVGCSIMPLIGVKNELKNGELKIIPIKGLPIETVWSLVWPKGKKHSPVVLAFLNHLEAYKEQIILNNFKS